MRAAPNEACYLPSSGSHGFSARSTHSMKASSSSDARWCIPSLITSASRHVGGTAGHDVRSWAASRHHEANSGTCSGCRGFASTGQLALVALRAVRMARCFVDEPDGHHPVATLADLRRVTPWLWVHCERCQHRSPAALVPLIIRWGADASSDVLRRCARCTRCGRKGASIQIPGWGGLEAPIRGWPKPPLNTHSQR